MRTLLIVPVLLLAPVSAASGQFGQCAHSAERTASVPASGATLARLAARAGSLRIEGRPGLTEVRVRGRACASRREHLDAIQLRSGREGGEVRLEVEMPQMRGSGNLYAMLDLVIEVPETLPLDVTDSSGDVEIRRVAAVRLDDSSGNIEISDVRGAVGVKDSSGDVTIRGVRGDVLLQDSSGDLTVDNVSGSVLVEEDSSGDIEIGRVGGEVAVRRDSSGDIRVRDVRGDFTVARDGSGSIDVVNVTGRVSIPSRKR